MRDDAPRVKERRVYAAAGIGTHSPLRPASSRAFSHSRYYPSSLPLILSSKGKISNCLRRHAHTLENPVGAIRRSIPWLPAYPLDDKYTHPREYRNAAIAPDNPAKCTNYILAFVVLRRSTTAAARSLAHFPPLLA